MPLNRMGIVPGTVGDMIVESQRQQAQRRLPRNPMQVRQRRMDEEVVRPVVDYRPSPMVGRPMTGKRRGGI
jgi:hypothetical protein